MKRLVCHRRTVSVKCPLDSRVRLGFDSLSLPDWGFFGQIIKSASFIYILKAGCPGTWWLPIQYVSLPKLGFSHTRGFLLDLGQARTLNFSFLFYTMG